MHEAAFIPCAASIHKREELTWLQLERTPGSRTAYAQSYVSFSHMLENTGGHWEETFWRLLARNFGMKVNADAFEELAQHSYHHTCQTPQQHPSAGRVIVRTGQFA